MTGLEQVAVAIWRCCLPGEPDLSWEDMLPNERRVALEMSRAAVVEIATIVRDHRNPARLLALSADKIAKELEAA